MNAEAIKRDTKERIIHHALPLFAEHGLDGVSVRNISKEANVNIAAINYHFQNKENLYSAVIQHSYNKIQEQIEKVESQREWTLEEFVLATWQMFLDQGAMLVATFKIIISGGPAFEQLCKSDRFCGPPGAATLIKVILREAPNASQEDIGRIMHILHVHMIQTAVLMSSTHFHQNPDVLKHENSMDLNQMRDSLKLLVKMCLEQLKKG